MAAILWPWPMVLSFARKFLNPRSQPVRKPTKPSKSRRNDKHQPDLRLTLEQRQEMLRLRSNPQQMAQLFRLTMPSQTTDH